MPDVAYDAENRISQVDGGATATYVYDADGRRVAKTTGASVYNECDPSNTTGGSTYYLYDLENRAIMFTASGVNGCKDEIYAGGRHLVTYEGAATFIHSDWLGTDRVRIAYPYVGIRAYDQHCTSLPFGDGLSGCGGSPYSSPLIFTGKERDPESGLDNFGARYNASNMGRFMTPDWSESPSPVPYASLPYPQSLNLYSYVQNNPLSHTDPNGHMECGGEKNHSWLWCAAHWAGYVQTEKEAATEKAAAEKARAAYEAFRQKMIKEQGWDPNQGYMAMGMYAGAMAGFGGLLDEGAATPVEPEAEPPGTPRAMVNGVPQPNPNGEIIVAPNGNAVKIPAGYVAELADNGNGIVYRPAGSTGNANIIRVSGPDARNPTGYFRIYNSEGQPIIPSTGNPGSKAQTHIPQ